MKVIRKDMRTGKIMKCDKNKIEITMSEIIKNIKIDICIKQNINYKIRNFFLFRVLWLASKISPFSVIININYDEVKIK